MGYRSQLAGIFSVDEVLHDKGYVYDKAKFKEMIGFIKLSRFYEVWNTKEETDTFGWKEGKFIFYGSDWKWYSEYDDVKAWEELWHSMQSIKGISGYFCRVGEGDGSETDIEQKEFGDSPCIDYFYPYAGLHFDAGNDFLGKRETEEQEQHPNNVRSTKEKV